MYGQSCFVATVVYRDINAPQIETLRGFRDEVLAQNPIGRRVIDFYYSGAGQRTAQMVNRTFA